MMEQNIIQKEEEINDLKKKNEIEEKSIPKKKNILQRLEAIEKINDEKDETIESLTERVEKLELNLQQVIENKADEVQTSSCEFCDFVGKNERGFKLHVKAKHEITIVDLNVFCKATEKYLSSDRDAYRKELESEIDVLEDVIDMDIDSSKVYDYVGKFLPLKIKFRTRIPTRWQSENFRNQIWERINKQIPKGKITEDKDEK